MAHHVSRPAATLEARGCPAPRIRPKPQRSAAALTLLSALALGPAPLAAQSLAPANRPSALGATTLPAPQPRLVVPPLIVGAPGGETTLAITLVEPGAVPPRSYLKVRGLAPQLTLSEGHAVAPGAWSVPMTALADLRIKIPPGHSGKSEVSIAIVSIDGGTLAEAKATLVVMAAMAGAGLPAAAAAPPPGPAVGPTGPPAHSRVSAPSEAAARVPQATAPPAADREGPQASGAAPAMSAASRQAAEGFLGRGRMLLADGDIASARLFFRRAADAGLADGAIAMGRTFDPNELAHMKAVGIRPDAAEARRWYATARSLGGGASAERLLQRLADR